jgi:hypothetical protein
VSKFKTVLGVTQENYTVGKMMSHITPAQDVHIWLLHMRDRLRPVTWTADETEEYFSVINPFCGDFF